MAESEYKTCRDCGQSKPAILEFFYQHHGKLGVCCKVCVIARAAAYQKAHPEKRREWTARSAEKNRARAKAWRLANPERSRQSHRRKREADPERYRQYVRDWIVRNPDLKRLRSSEMQIRRRARMFGNGNAVDLVDYSAILERYGMVCHICGQGIEPDATGAGKLNFDHVIPLAKGGSHSAENIKPSHAKCNRAKWDRLL